MLHPSFASLLESPSAWTRAEVATALAVSKQHEDPDTRKAARKALETHAPEALAALKLVFKASLGRDDKKFTKKLLQLDDTAVDVVAFASAAFQLSNKHIGFRYRIDQGGEIARKALTEDLDENGALTLGDPADLVELPHVRGLRSLQLYKMRVKKKQLPEEIGQLDRLQELRLNEIKIATLGTSIAMMPSLQTLACVNVPLSKGLGSLPDSLESLTLQSCALTDLEALCHPSLHTLQVSGVDGIPPAGLPNLRQLRAFAWRGAGSLPGGFFELERLETLTLSAWTQTSLPDRLGSLRAVRSLHLNGCRQLRRLPTSMAEMSALDDLDLVFCESLDPAIPEWLSELPIRRLRVQYSPWEHQEEALREMLPDVKIVK
ncbi:MAG: leucine-rich repeat domain-containing protein [Sandaracinaceae bacterium]